MDEITLAVVAKRTGIPIGSIYHFYPKINELFAAATSRFHTCLKTRLSEPYAAQEASSWQTIVESAIKRAALFYNERPDGRHLILSEKSSPDIRTADRYNDQILGNIMMDIIQQHFELPTFPNRLDIFFYAVEIADLFFMLSNIRHGKITESFCVESQRAIVSYLRNYLPSYLPPIANKP
ncbi:hypothetical protein D9M69_565090 [compost metagenome]